MERLASETIWSRGQLLIPMCEVSHIEEYPNGGHVIFKHSTWSGDFGQWEPTAWLGTEDLVAFKRDYCAFRSEIDPVQKGP